MTDKPIEILVVEDSGVTRNMLSLLIGAQPDMEMVGTASTGHEAVRRATELAGHRAHGHSHAGSGRYSGDVARLRQGAAWRRDHGHV
jgi:hypothetical protein